MRHAATPTFLVTGGSGQVGFELVRELAVLGQVVAPTRAELDVADPRALRAFVRALAPTVVVNAAAYTAVDQAESDEAACALVNAEAPAVLAEEARRAGAALVHFSTDYVFDGRKGAPYVETDAPAPLNVYGATKLAGERAVIESGAASLVLRLSWVFGGRGRNFMRTVLRLAREPRELRIVCDQVGAPTASPLAAAAAAQLLGRALARPGGVVECLREAGGVYHLGAGGETTWHAFAEAILQADPARGEHRCTGVRPVPTSEYPTSAARPRYSVLGSDRLAAAFGVRLPPWEEHLRLTLAG